MISRMGKNFYLFLICIILNIFFSNQNPNSFPIMLNIKEEPIGFYINNIDGQSPCEKWFPSLFIPTLLIPKSEDEIPSGKEIDGINLEINIPFLNRNKNISVEAYENVPFLKKEYTDILLKSIESGVNLCYLGISPGINIYKNLERDHNILKNLQSKGFIKNRIFSFDKWNLNYNTSNFYLGESNPIFNSNEGNIGTCENYFNDPLWGCSFKKLLLNNIDIPIINNEGNLYRIYFSSETNDLYFPKAFEEIFRNSSNNLCYVDNYNYLICKNSFKNSNFLPLQLTEEKENFIITGQVDNINRFNIKSNDRINETRITFENINYIILPIMVFKEFYIKFDADNNLISFYTNNTDLLKVKEKKKNESSVGTVLIILLIILIILGLSYAAYWFFVKRRKNIQPNINTFSKFEDEEDYKNLNEKKVF